MTYILVCYSCEVIAVTSQNLEYTGEELCEDSSMPFVSKLSMFRFF